MIHLLAVCLMFLAQPSPAAAGEKPVVAVFDIETQGVDLSPEMLERLSEYLGSRMAAAGQFQVVPREQIRERLVQQKKESYSTCFDQSCQIEIGKELAAEKSLATKLIKLGSRCTVALTLYDLKRAATDNAATVHGGCSEDEIVNSLDQAVDQMHREKSGAKAEAEPAESQPPPVEKKPEPEKETPATGAETHEGFFARVAVGAGWGMDTVKDDAQDEAKVTGAANTSSVAVGYVLGNNLALHGSFFHATMINPETSKAGDAVDGGAKYLATGFGVGLTYYIMPANIYLSASLDIAVLKATIGPLEFTSRAGFGADLLVGKEWWILDELGIGLALQAIFVSVPSQFDTNHATFGIAGLLSLTYD